MRKTTTIFLFVICLPVCVFSFSKDSIAIQVKLTEAVELQRKFKPYQAISILKKILPSYKTLYGSESIEVSDVLLNLGSCYLDVGEYPLAIKFLLKSLDIMTANLSPNSVKIGDCYTLLGIYYDYNFDYKRALYFYNKSLEVYNNCLGPNDARLGSLYNNMGICIYYNGDIKRAIIYFEKAFSIMVDRFGINYFQSAQILTNIGISYSKMKKFRKAAESFKRAKEIAENAKTINTVTGARTFHSIGINYFEMQDYGLALENLEKALLIRLEEVGEYHPEVGASYYSIGLCYLRMNDLVAAQKYFSKSLKVAKLKFGKYHPEIGVCIDGLSRVEIARGNCQHALSYIEDALTAFEFDEKVSIIKDLLPNKNLMEALNTKAAIHFLLYKKNHQIDHLLESHRIYEFIIGLIEKFRLSYKEDRSKEILAEEFYAVYDGSIEVNYELFELTKESSYLEKAFRSCEKSTSLVLLEGFRTLGAKSDGGVPVESLKKENDLKIEITIYEKQKHEEELKGEEDKDINKIAELNSKIFDLKQEYYNLISHLEEDYPEFLKLKTNLTTVTVDEIQQELDDGQTLVEYFLGEHSLFVFVINKQSFHVKKIEKDFPLEEWVEFLRSKIIRYQFPFNLPDIYHDELIETAHQLYLKLVEPVESLLSNRLLIIPGDVLAYLPFEALIKNIKGKPFEYKQHQYLLHDYSIGYCYSGTLLLEMLKRNLRDENYTILAMAPAFGKDVKPFQVRSFDFAALKYNIQEAEVVSQLTGGDLVAGHLASEAYFNEAGRKYDIIHLATHAKADEDEGEFSLLAFTEIPDTLENERLFVKEIQNIELKCNMLTLSACETGIGERRKGEGIISLARSFSLSGAHCINTSLWKVSDKKTTDLMELFYKNIKDGVAKDKALSLSKQQFLKNFRHAEAHPFYWSPFISIGDMTAFDKSLFSIRFSWLWYLPGIIVLLIIFVYFRFRI